MELATNLAPSMVVMPALVLDMDGTVRKSKSGEMFIRNSRDIELLPNIEKYIWLYRNMGYLIFALSNQGGVAHGHKLPIEIEGEMDATLKLFKVNPFHSIQYCFHEAKGNIFPYNYRSLGRKPDIGLLYIMEADAYKAGIVVDWDRSLFVGDRPEDEQCAKNAGIPFRHINSFLWEPHEFDVND